VTHDDKVRVVAAVLGAFSTPDGPTAWSDEEIAFFSGLYAGKWPTGNQTFDRVAVALVRELRLFDAPAPVQPVAPRELTEAEIEECALAGAIAIDADEVFLSEKGRRRDSLLGSATAVLDDREEEVDIDDRGDYANFCTAVLAKAAEIRARPPAAPQPAPGATVDEVMAAVEVLDGCAIDENRLRAALSTLSPAQLRGMLTAIGDTK